MQILIIRNLIYVHNYSSLLVQLQLLFLHPHLCLCANMLGYNWSVMCSW